MSLTSLNTAVAANAGRTMLVLHPTDRTPLTDAKGRPVTVDLLGRDSDVFVQAENIARNKAVEAIKEGVKFSSAAADLAGAETLARATTGWSGIPKGWIDGTDDETPASFSFQNAVALYSNKGVAWLRDQADKFIGDRANFLSASPKA